jgi:hypothetical protein
MLRKLVKGTEKVWDTSIYCYYTVITIDTKKIYTLKKVARKQNIITVFLL